SGCRHVPNDGACSDGMRCSATLGCVAIGCTSAADCADGNACNGAETCAPGTPGADPTTGCVPGAAPDCDDHVACTTDTCNMGTGCAHATNDAMCSDGFACTTDTCSATGCHFTTNDVACNGGCLSGATCVVGV